MSRGQMATSFLSGNCEIIKYKQFIPQRNLHYIEGRLIANHPPLCNILLKYANREKLISSIARPLVSYYDIIKDALQQIESVTITSLSLGDEKTFNSKAYIFTGMVEIVYRDLVMQLGSGDLLIGASPIHVKNNYRKLYVISFD